MRCGIGSGIFGIYVYLGFPRQLAANSSGQARAALFAELFELDRKGRELARACDPAVNIAVKSSIERTMIGGGAFATSCSARTVHASCAPSRELVAAGGAGSPTTPISRPSSTTWLVVCRRPSKRVEAANLQALTVLLCRRQAVLRRIRRDIGLHAWLRLWLYVHVPLTIALLAALVIHIVTTFMYW